MKLKKFDTMNVVPFIDIMLVLLVIVLITATFVARGIIPVDLSIAKATKAIKKKDSLTITITKNNDLYLNKLKVYKKQFLQELIKFDKNSDVMINCDKSVVFEEFVYVIDILKNNSFKNLGIVTKYE